MYTVYEFLELLGQYKSLYIYVDGKNITGDEPVKLEDIKLHYEERECVLNALERTVLTFDAVQDIIYC